MTNTTTATKITVATDMRADLAYACIGPRYTEEYGRAELIPYAETVIAEEVVAAFGMTDRLDALQVALSDAAGSAWVAAAIRIGTEMGYEVDAVDTRDARVLDTQTRTYADEDGGDTIEREIWQAAHDAITIGQDDDENWGVW